MNYCRSPFCWIWLVKHKPQGCEQNIFSIHTVTNVFIHLTTKRTSSRLKEGKEKNNERQISVWDTVSLQIRGLEFSSGFGELMKDHSLRDFSGITQKDVISNLKDEITHLTSMCNFLCNRAVEHAAFLFIRMPTRVHFNIHPHMCPVNLPARRNNNFTHLLASRAIRQ